MKGRENKRLCCYKKGTLALGGEVQVNREGEKEKVVGDEMEREEG